MVLTLIGVLLLTACRASASGQYSATATSSQNTQINLSGGGIYYEYYPSSEQGGAVFPEGRMLTIEKVIDGRLHAVHITMPPQVASGEYEIIGPTTDQQIINAGTPRADYYVVAPGQLAMYSDDLHGRLVIEQAGEALSGSFEFTGQEMISDEVIMVSGSFQQVTYSTQPHTSPKLPDRAEIDVTSGSAVAPRMGTASAFVILAALVLINFAFQFWVGSQVYERGAIWRSLRGTGTFIRGWRVPELRWVMVAWSITLTVLLVTFCWLGVLAAS